MDIAALSYEIENTDSQKLYNEIDNVLKTEKTTLNNCKINYSKLDPLSDIIEKDGKIYRGIKPEKIDFFKRLYSTGILQTLAKNEILPNFNLTMFKTIAHPLIIEIEKLRIIPPAFWSYSMLRQEAIFKLQLIELLNCFNYTLIDGHPFNSVFKNNKPVFIDFGSIIEGNKSQYAKKEILQYNAFSMLMLENNNIFARPFLYSKNFNTLPLIPTEKSKEYKKLFVKKIGFLNLIKRYKFKKGTYSTKDFLNLFKEKYLKKRTYWATYIGDIQNLKITPRYQKVIDKVKKFSPNITNFLDIAGNSGYFANWIKEQTQIKEIISTDYDETAIEIGREKFSKNKVSMFVLNFVQKVENAQYFKCDAVCALAISHHILLSEKYSISSFFSDLKKYTNRYVYVEFCPLGLWAETLEVNIPKYYTQQWFEEHFKIFFKLLDKEVIEKVTINNTEFDRRILYVGEIL